MRAERRKRREAVLTRDNRSATICNCITMTDGIGHCDAVFSSLFSFVLLGASLSPQRGDIVVLDGEQR